MRPKPPDAGNASPVNFGLLSQAVLDEQVD
jgi:hypothetical protein